MPLIGRLASSLIRNAVKTARVKNWSVVSSGKGSLLRNMAGAQEQ
jgi:hypothetical protein